MAPTALVTGATGLLGRQVVEAFKRANWTVYGTGFTRANPPSVLKVDLCNTSEIEQVLDETKPQVLVHCAAQRFPDKVESDPEGSRKLNIDASRNLAEISSARSILLIYISTDYVFSGLQGEAPYEASARTGPTNLYGQMKLDGENAVLDATRSTNLGIVLRVPVLYGPTETGNGESAVNTLMDSLLKAQKEKVVMDDWSIRYPTNTEDVGRVCSELAKVILHNREQGGEVPGRIFQFSAEERFTKYGICELFAEIMGMGMGLMEANKMGNDPGAKVQRPFDCHLSTKALKDIGVNVTAQDFKAWWRWQVKAYRK